VATTRERVVGTDPQVQSLNAIGNTVVIGLVGPKDSRYTIEIPGYALAALVRWVVAITDRDVDSATEAGDASRLKYLARFADHLAAILDDRARER
jgi:hypothetical protein